MNLLMISRFYIGLQCLFSAPCCTNTASRKSHLIVESYVAGNQALLDEAESFDHVYDIMGNTRSPAAVKMNENWRRYENGPLPDRSKTIGCLNTPNVNAAHRFFRLYAVGPLTMLKN